MKHIIFNIFVLISAIGYAQVIIGNNLESTEDKSSVLMEFGNTNDRGIILPCVTNDIVANQSQYSEGTILLDAHDAHDARIKYFDGTSWIDLSGTSGDADAVLDSQPTVTEEPSKGLIVGADTTTANGVLVLESTEKVMVLPYVEGTDDIIDPSPGMMVYVNKDDAKRLAVYNGTNWSYWSNE